MSADGTWIFSPLISAPCRSTSARDVPILGRLTLSEGILNFPPFADVASLGILTGLFTFAALCSHRLVTQSTWRGGEQWKKIILLIPAPLVIKGSTSTPLIGSLLPFFANRHPKTAYPEERSRGGESEDTPAHTVRGVHGKDAADNMR